MKLKTIALVAALTGVSVLAQAQSGTLSFADIGSASVDGGNIGTATVFNIGDLLSTGSSTGAFTGLPSQSFGSISFNVTSPTSLSFDNLTFGTFASTSIELLSQGSGTTDIYVLGNYTGGAYDPSTSGVASFHITFNQTPAGTGSISDSAGLSIPPEPVPEPATMALAALGGASLLLFRRRK